MTRFCRLAGSVAVAAMLAACSNSEQAKKKHFDDANRFVAEGKLQEAIVEFRNALKEDSKYGEARLALADAYSKVGNHNQAFREYVRAADLLPQNNDAQLRAAEYLIAATRFEDAGQRAQQVIARDPSNLQAQMLLGYAKVGMKDLDGAVREIEEAIKLDPARGTSYSSLATVKLAQGQKDEAKAAFEKAVEVDPGSVRARLGLAYFQWSNNDLVAAEESLKKAVATESKNALANRTMAVFYMSTKRPQLAEPFMKALAANGPPSSSLELADYYLSLNRVPDASAVLEPLTKDPATAGAAETRLAAIAFAAKNDARGNSLLDGVIKREPSNVQARLFKAQWLIGQNRLPEALQQAQEAVKADGKSVPAHYALAVTHDRLNHRKEAIAEFNEVLRLNPRATAAQVSLSRLNLLEGNAESAVTFAESALNGAPTSPEARVSLVRGLLARRELSRAEQELAPLVKEYPKAGVVQTLDGWLRLQKKDFAGARASYERALSLSPTSSEALAGLTGLDLLENKAPQARARLEQRIAAEPRRTDLLMLAAQVYGQQKEFSKAEATLRQAIQIDSSQSRAYSMLAAVLLASGKLEQARVEFDQIAARDGSNLAAETMSAIIVNSQNKIGDAKKRYEAIVNAHPTAAVAANNLAWIYAEEGDKLDEALRLAQGAAARLPENPEVHDTIGWIYLKKELPVLAVSSFEKSIEKAPENPNYHTHLAMALAKAGNTARARSAAEQALKLKPGDAAAQKVLAEIKG